MMLELIELAKSLKSRFKKLLELGEEIFAARWTKLDGQGRPAVRPLATRE
jgi:hypothetical protein